MGRAKTGTGSVNRAERQRRAARLRRAGCTLQEIADDLCCSIVTVHRDLRALVDTLHAEALHDLDAWKSAQLAELQQVRDEAWEAWRNDESPTGTRHDVATLRTILVAQEREAKLLGLEHTIGLIPTQTMTDEEARAILAERDALDKR